MKHFSLFTLFSVATLLGAAISSPVHAASLNSGDLIKGSGDSVYYVGQTSKRYVFPTAKTFFSWYSDFSSVKTISDGDLQSLQIGGNVTYRPGVKLIKITTDPKVYAVAAHGILRWIQTENIASTLYGNDWNKNVDDIPDAFFVNYTVGTPISSVQQFTPALEISQAVNINVDKQLSVNGLPLVTMSVDRTSVPAGETATLTINTIFQGSGTLQNILIKNNGSLMKYCSSNPCVIQTAPLALSSNNTFTAEVTDTNGYTGISNAVTVASPGTPAAPTSTTPFPFTVSKNPATAGDIETLAVSLTANDGVSRIDLYFNGSLVQTCNSYSCTTDVQIPTIGGQASYSAEARVTRISQSTLTQTITITMQATGSSYVHLSVGQAQITSNQAASAIVTIDPNISINRVDIYVDGNAVKGCIDGSRSCRWSDFLTGAVGSAHPVYAVVTDNLSRKYTSETRTITISTTDSPSVTVATAKSTIYTGESVDVNVSASDNDGIAWSEIWNGDTLIKHCVGAAPCTASTGPWTLVGQTISFTGKASDTKGTIGLGDAQTVSVVKPN